MSKKLALVAGVLVVIVWAAELSLPLLPPHLNAMRSLLRRSDGPGGYDLQPGVELHFSGMFGRISPPVTWQVNQQGLRAAGPVGRPSERFRVASYGDSEVFGVSVDLEDTFAARMEAIDPRVEVLNLGVPGYNAAQVADRIETTVPIHRPDLVLYLVNKNDTDAPIEVGDRWFGSNLLLRLRFLYQVLVAYPARVEARHSPERLAFLADQLDRIAAHTEAAGTPLLLAFMKSRTWGQAREHASARGFSARTGLGGGGLQRVIGVQDLVEGHPRRDDHMGPPAHRELAERLCAVIADGAPGRCTPSDWHPLDRRERVAAH